MWTLLLFHLGLGVLAWDWTLHLLGASGGWWGFWREVGYQVELWDARKGYPLHRWGVRCRYCHRGPLMHMPHVYDRCLWEPKEEPPAARPVNFLQPREMWARIRIPAVQYVQNDPQAGLRWAREYYQRELQRMVEDMNRAAGPLAEPEPDLEDFGDDDEYWEDPDGEDILDEGGAEELL